MTKSEDLAMRILIVYESSLPMDGRANLAQRAEAMMNTVRVLGLTETVPIPMLGGVPPNFDRTKNWAQG